MRFLVENYPYEVISSLVSGGCRLRTSVTYVHFCNGNVGNWQSLGDDPPIISAV